MIGYVTLGTNDLARATAFYDALLGEIGIKRLMDLGRGVAWGTAMDKPALGILTPYDGQPATVGNGVMVALIVDSREKVDRVYRKAWDLDRILGLFREERGKSFDPELTDVFLATVWTEAAGAAADLARLADPSFAATADAAFKKARASLNRRFLDGHPSVRNYRGVRVVEVNEGLDVYADGRGRIGMIVRREMR